MSIQATLHIQRAAARLRRGQSAAEYGLIGAIIAVGAISILSFMGGNLRAYMNGVVNFISSALS